MHCCASFLVSRSAVQSYPKAFWQALLAVAQSQRQPPAHYSGTPAMWVGGWLEHSWHVLFGRPLSMLAPEPLCPNSSSSSSSPAPFLAAQQCPGSPCGAAGDREQKGVAAVLLQERSAADLRMQLLAGA
jgi:hypothetical protein